MLWLIKVYYTSYLLWQWQMKGKGMLQKNGVRKYPGPVAFFWRAKQSVWLAGSNDIIVFVRLYTEPSDQRGFPSSCGATEERYYALCCIHVTDITSSLSLKYQKQNSSSGSKCCHGAFSVKKVNYFAQIYSNMWGPYCRLWSRQPKGKLSYCQFVLDRLALKCYSNLYL